MDLFRFQDRVYLAYKNAGFVWESEWDMFRPIRALTWNGSTFVLDDRGYCDDPTNPQYGFGSAEMRQACVALTTKYRDHLGSAKLVQTPQLGPVEWWIDRFVSLSPCASRDRAAWKQMHKGKYFTLRRAPRNRLTRRNRESKHNAD